jgi:hypothetical protein
MLTIVLTAMAVLLVAGCLPQQEITHPSKRLVAADRVFAPPGFIVDGTADVGAFLAAIFVLTFIHTAYDSNAASASVGAVFGTIGISATF